jgi:lipase maturation factor 1
MIAPHQKGSVQCLERWSNKAAFFERMMFGSMSKDRLLPALLTKLQRGHEPASITFSFASWLFLRLLGFIYLIAFWSLSTQILGLVGERGILPAGVFLQSVSQRVGPERVLILPTVFWIDAGNAFLQTVTLAGAALSIGLALGFFELPILCLLWLFYLSLFVVSGGFLSFQWDLLLLETGFLAIFLAPVSSLWVARTGAFSPPKLIHWLFRWLLFRLIFSSGVVKLASGDPTWRTLTALQYHYETQPLPTRAAWYFHQLPAGFQEFSVVVMFIIELWFPFLILGSKNPRLLGTAGIAFLQLLIFITGNYSFFNLLTLALCILLVDDSLWPKRWTLARYETEQGTKRIRHWPKWVHASLVVSVLQFPNIFHWRGIWPSFVVQIYRSVEPFHIVHSYGLFAVMTTERSEIIIEGSFDEKTWYPYEFKYKPGDLKRPPMQVAPHQPRLDWQMWFAAFGSYQNDPWFINFATRLLQGSPDTLKLLQANPFPDRPPRYLRGTLYDYHFTDLATLKRERTWWRRERIGDYTPTLALKDDKGRQVAAPVQSSRKQ